MDKKQVEYFIADPEKFEVNPNDIQLNAKGT